MADIASTYVLSMFLMCCMPLQDINDTSLCVLMSSITKGCDVLNDVVDKVNTALTRLPGDVVACSGR